MPSGRHANDTLPTGYLYNKLSSPSYRTGMGPDRQGAAPLVSKTFEPTRRKDGRGDRGVTRAMRERCLVGAPSRCAGKRHSARYPPRN